MSYKAYIQQDFEFRDPNTVVGGTGSLYIASRSAADALPSVASGGISANGVNGITAVYGGEIIYGDLLVSSCAVAGPTAPATSTISVKIYKNLYSSTSELGTLDFVLSNPNPSGSLATASFQKVTSPQTSINIDAGDIVGAEIICQSGVGLTYAVESPIVRLHGEVK